jgi:UDPglucose 6-dehydrogenase
MREAPSIKIANHLYAQEADIVAYDPKAIANAQERFIRDTIKISYAECIEDCLKEAECCMILTEWEEFESITPSMFNKYMKRSVIIDGRRMYNSDMHKLVDRYRGIGLGSNRAHAAAIGNLRAMYGT